MSSQAQGFVRNERFGSGRVIAGTNREVSRKWRALGVPEVRAALVTPGACPSCGVMTCRCGECTRFFGAACVHCAGMPGVKPV